MSNNYSEEEITRSHRWHAIEYNNLAWDLAGQPSRTDLQNEEMLNAAHVAGEADLQLTAAGVALLFVYALAFAVPMLAVGYVSQALRPRVRAIAARPLVVRWASGLLLVAFGAVILRKGMLFAGM